MYPLSFFGLFPPFPRNDRAFVAMSFDTRFDKRWSDILAPALRAIVPGKTSEPFRVDLSHVSDAILTDILSAISDSLVIVADITSLDDRGGRPVRNANVLYEVGLAHATRLPEEVVLFRSDAGPLDFDIAGVRVHSYDPDADPNGARQFVRETVSGSLAGLDARRRASVRAACERLTMPAISALSEILNMEAESTPPRKRTGHMLGAIELSQGVALLLELGAIRADLTKVTPEMVDKQLHEAGFFRYRPTLLGEAMIDYVNEKLDIADPVLVERLSK